MYNIHYFIYFMHKICTKHCILCMFIHYIRTMYIAKFCAQNRHRVEPHIYTLNTLYNTNLHLPVCRVHFYLTGHQNSFHLILAQTPKKNTPFLMCSLSRSGISHYSMCLLSHSSLKSFKPSMRSYSISKGRYTVLPFK